MATLFGILAVAGALGTALLALRVAGLRKAIGKLELEREKLRADLALAEAANAGHGDAGDRRDEVIVGLEEKLRRLRARIKKDFGANAANILFDEEVGPR